MGYFYGIDFGTTSSAVVGTYIDNGIRADYFGDAEGLPIPSVVAIDKVTGDVFTGREAWKKRTELSESCEFITSVKSFLDQKKTLTIAGGEWTPEDIACELFKSLKNTVAETTDYREDLDTAMVSIPVGFSPEKRDVLRRAAKRANINISSFVSEPTAAFFSNYSELKACSTVAVFDWGGGTLDVSILRNNGGQILELAKTGKNIAGDYIDEKLARRIHAKIAMKNNKEISFDDMPPSARDKLLVKTEDAKRKFSDVDSLNIAMVNYGDFGIVNEKMDYATFCDIVQPEIEMAMDCLKDAIDQSKVGRGNIDRILMVGGTSKLKPLITQMRAEYGDLLFVPESPDWDVGHGASLLSIKAGENYSNQSVGLLLSDNSYFSLLDSNTPLNNWSKDFVFGIVDKSEDAQFVFDGSQAIRQMTDHCRSLKFEAYYFLQEKIKMHVYVDENLVFHAEVCSSMMPTNTTKIWSYPNLKCYYKLPEA